MGAHVPPIIYRDIEVEMQLARPNLLGITKTFHSGPTLQHTAGLDSHL